MISLSDLPAVNASLNGLSLILLILGYHSVKHRRIERHWRFMVSAFGVSMLFLTTYVIYRVLGADKHFRGQGWVRPVYYFILITHVTLAITVPILASRTIFLAWRGKWDAHRRIARWTFPIWVYVSITGVAVYVMLFRLYPG